MKRIVLTILSIAMLISLTRCSTMTLEEERDFCKDQCEFNHRCNCLTEADGDKAKVAECEKIRDKCQKDCELKYKENLKKQKEDGTENKTKK